MSIGYYGLSDIYGNIARVDLMIISGGEVAQWLDRMTDFH
jgi:hypothetical protein